MADLDPKQALRFAARITDPSDAANAYVKIALQLVTIDEIAANASFSQALKFHRREYGRDWRVDSLVETAKRVLAEKPEWALLAVKAALEQIAKTADIEARQTEVDIVLAAFPTLAKHPEVIAEITELEAKSRRDVFRKHSKQLEKALSVVRTEADISDVKKTAARYRPDAKSRRIRVGEGEEPPELSKGFEIVRYIEAVLSHPELFQACGIKTINLRKFTSDLKHISKLKIYSLEFPELLGGLEKIGAIEIDYKIWDAGAPGCSGAIAKVYVSAATYESVIDELWTLFNRLATFVRDTVRKHEVR